MFKLHISYKSFWEILFDYKRQIKDALPEYAIG